jgi:hypothetical protein
MKIRKGLIVLPILFTSLIAFAKESPEPATTSSSYSMQKSVLVYGSAPYVKWKAWIDEQNRDSSAKNAHGTVTHGEAGQITIILQTTLPQPQSAEPSSLASNPSPPTPLPVTGDPGQQITIINQTPAIYQQWVYEWDVSGQGGGGWNPIYYAEHVCAPKPGLNGVLCPATL